MKKQIYLLTLLTASLLFSTLDGMATTYHVKTTGSDSDNGTSWTTAFQTLQKALDRCFHLPAKCSRHGKHLHQYI